MLALHKPRPSAVDAVLDRLPLMPQTEDQFSSLTHAVVSLLGMYGLQADPDAVGAVTGDCFAVQVFPATAVDGIAGCPELLQQGLTDLGLSVQLLAEDVNVDNRMRVFALVRAGLRSYRPSLACGGWPANDQSVPDCRWGIVNHSHPTEARFLGSTMRSTFLAPALADEVPWPQHEAASGPVILVEHWRDPQLPPDRLARRALQRGLSLLTGELGFGGPGEVAQLCHWLSTSGSLKGDPHLRIYPYPALVVARCRFEAMARYLARAQHEIPRRKHAACAKVLDVAQRSAKLLLDHEPQRSYARDDVVGVGRGMPPWPLTAWEERAAALAEAGSGERERQIRLAEQLQGLHSELVAAMDALLARG